MATVYINYTSSVEIFKTENPHQEISERMTRFAENILSVMVDGEIIYTKQ